MKYPLIAALLGLLVIAPAHALEKEPFTKERFSELQQQGELILVDVFADWCSTCARQQTILQKYRDEHPEVDLHILEVDYDKDRRTVRDLRAPRQSTLLLYRGDKQFWFSVAETREDVIFEAINTAVDFEE